MANKKILTEIGKSLNGKIADCEFCDKKQGFKVCSKKCTKSIKEEFCDNCNNDICVCTIKNNTMKTKSKDYKKLLKNNKYDF